MITESKAARTPRHTQSTGSFGDLMGDATPDRGAPSAVARSKLKYRLRWLAVIFCIAFWVVLAAIFIW